MKPFAGITVVFFLFAALKFSALDAATVQCPGFTSGSACCTSPITSPCCGNGFVESGGLPYPESCDKGLSNGALTSCCTSGCTNVVAPPSVSSSYSIGCSKQVSILTNSGVGSIYIRGTGAYEYAYNVTIILAGLVPGLKIVSITGTYPSVGASGGSPLVITFNSLFYGTENVLFVATYCTGSSTYHSATFGTTSVTSSGCCPSASPPCGNGILGYPGSCCTQACGNLANDFAQTANISVSSCKPSFSNSDLKLTSISNLSTANFSLYNVSGPPGLTASYNGSLLTFSPAYTVSPVTLIFAAVQCGSTVSYYTRYVSSSCCGNGIVEVSEQCDNSIAGGCCIPSTCRTATSSNVINSNLANDTTTYTVSYGFNDTLFTINLSSIGFASANTNYPPTYSVVSAIPDQYTYAPYYPPAWNATGSSLTWFPGYAGTYIVNISAAYCTASGGTFYFTRKISMPATPATFNNTCSFVHTGTSVLCSYSNVHNNISQINYWSKCDCSLQSCYTGVPPEQCGQYVRCAADVCLNDGYGGSITGLPRVDSNTTKRVCGDLLVRKPVTINYGVYSENGPFQLLLYNVQFTCAAVCGDGIVDTGESCDTGGAPSSCCTSSCSTTGQSTGVASTGSVVLPPNVCTTFVNTSTMLLTNNTANFNYSWQVVSATGVAGVSVSAVNGTGVYFSAPFTGTLVVTLRAVFCSTTGSHVDIVRTVTMAGCCGNSVQEAGEACDLGARNGGVNGTCCSTQCAFILQSLNYVCRAAVGGCDAPETCSGTSASCPADAAQPNGYVCTDPANPCISQTTCNGVSKQCNSTALPSTTLCRASADLCDAPEYCSGGLCPADLKYDATHLCRPVNGTCDVADYCTTGGNSCPADAYQSSTYVCRTNVSFCDLPETCTGTSAACPADAFKANTILCDPSTGLCQSAGYCSGTTSACNPASLLSSDALCSSSPSACQDSMYCTGSSALCPSPTVSPSTRQCRAAGGVCNPAEYCDGVNIDCPANYYYNSSYLCRAANGTCDQAEFCTGFSDDCPADITLSSGTICSASSGPCQNDALCDGVSHSCPTATLRSSSYICGPSTGPCDPPETCDGVSTTCPANVISSSSTICSASTGPCMPTTYCSGVDGLCHTLALYGSDTVCRPQSGDCDIADNCTGTSALCPPDAVQPYGHVCGSTVGSCNQPPTCTGTSKVCPSVAVSNGAACHFDANLCFQDYWNVTANQCVRGAPINYDDGIFCNGAETCDPATGRKVSGTPPACNDNNSCTQDYCSNVLGACEFVPHIDTTGPCGGGLGVCAVLGQYVCDGNESLPIVQCAGQVLPSAEICGDGLDNNCDGHVDEYCNVTAASLSECLDPGQCRLVSWSAGVCSYTYLGINTQCNDGVRCTTNDRCNDYGTCAGSPIVCDDFNDCTHDYCDEAQNGRCVFNGTYYTGEPCTLPGDPCSCSSQCTNLGECVSSCTLQCSGVHDICTEFVCNSSTGACDQVSLAGSPCDDQNACTYNDVCTASGCVGSPVLCDDYISCTDDLCVAPCGSCQHSISAGSCYIDGRCYAAGDVNPNDPCLVCDPATYTSAWAFVSGFQFCDDEDPCTVLDTCNLVTLQCAGIQIDCSSLGDGVGLKGVCSYGQCITVPINVGNPCNDGLHCTQNDVVQSDGSCRGTPVDCSPYSTVCSSSACSELAMGCTSTPVPDYMACSSVDAASYCIGGVCTHTTPPNCSTLNTQCLDYTLIAATGECVSSPRFLQSCNDSNVCTIGDFCGVDGVCYPGTIILDCNDDNPCTDDYCHTDAGCVHTQVAGCTSINSQPPACNTLYDCPEVVCTSRSCNNNACTYTALSQGSRCSDGNACNGEEYCVGNGVCVSIFQPICDDGNPCTSDFCDPSLGCVFAPLTDVACDDRNPCTLNDTCIVGTCTGVETECLANTDCLTRTCNAVDGEAVCTYLPVRLGKSCAPVVANLCEVEGVCDQWGDCSTIDRTCQPPIDCVSSYACDSLTGGCNPVYEPNDQPCRVDDLCHTSFCDGQGACIVDNAFTVTCPPKNQCQLEGVCASETGECHDRFKDNGVACDDGDACTHNDVCTYGECIGEVAQNCPSIGPCQKQGVCNKLNGVCSYENYPDNYPCTTLNNSCVEMSVCLSGTCSVLVPVRCEERPCHTSYCDPLHGCLYVPDDGAACDDLNECTSNTTCSSGVCGGGMQSDCFNEIICGQSYCSPNYGCLLSVANDCAACTNTSDCPYYACKQATCFNGTCSYVPDDLALNDCNDGQAANGEEHCYLGTCMLGTPPSCDDDNPCTADSYDYAGQRCVHEPLSSGSSCLQGTSDLCALEAQCDAQGNCLTQQSRPCDDSNPCRVSTGCNPSTGLCTYLQLDDASACNSKDSCSDHAKCYNGVCNVVDYVDCHTTGWCSSSTYCIEGEGVCAPTIYNDDLPCSDNNDCTVGDTCNSAFMCIPGEYSPCQERLLEDPQCQALLCSNDTAATCTVVNLDDQTPCFTGIQRGPCSGSDVCLTGRCTRLFNAGFVCREADQSGCDVEEVCVHDYDYCPHDDKVANGTACESQYFCYSTTCQDGQCLRDLPTDCSAYDTECTSGYCDEQARSCTYTNKMNGLSCMGSEFGQCVSYSSCYYGYCATYYYDTTVSCDDSNICTYDEHCSGYDNSCIGGVELNCTYLNTQCSQGVCSDLTGLCYSENVNEGALCNADTNPCTVNDTCLSGACVVGQPMNCSYLNEDCQYGTCVAQTSTAAQCEVVVTNSQCSPTACQGNCTVPFEWWAVHNSHCPSNRLFVWPNGMETQTMCGNSYYAWSQVQYKSFAWRFLFQQWLAARLNIINGACVPVSTQASLAAAYALLVQCDTQILLTDVAAATYKTLAIAIYSYNTGAFGPGLCNPTACLAPPFGDAHCLFLSGLLSARDFEPSGDDDSVCVNGAWNPGLVSCECTPGWTGIYCDECGAPDDPSLMYVCVPSLAGPWAYTLRSVPAFDFDRYFSDTSTFALVSMTNRTSVYPGTEGLDCGCQYSSGGLMVSGRSSRDITISATDTDITVYLTALNTDLSLCTEFFDIVVSSNNQGNCQIDGVFCTVTNDGGGNCSGVNSSFPDDCHCCRQTDVDCVCPNDDARCLRNHYNAMRHREQLYSSAMWVLVGILGLIFFTFIGYLIYHAFARPSGYKVIKEKRDSNRSSAKEPISSSLFTMKKRTKASQHQD